MGMCGHGSQELSPQETEGNRQGGAPASQCTARPQCRVQESQGRVWGQGRVVQHCFGVNLASSSQRAPWPRSRGGCSSQALLWGQGPRHRGKGRKRKAERRSREVGRDRQQELERQRERGEGGTGGGGMPRHSWGEGVETTTSLGGTGNRPAFA